MDNLVNLTTQDGVAVITINNPPVNALSPGVPEGLVAALDAAEKDASARAIVIIGGGRTFIAGADIKELELAASGRGSGPPKFHDILARIEDSSKPVVMAIHGTALGGGNEVAMAGHYRVAVPDAQIGQPEVNLGIIPGAEGTQRLPRLVGVAAAVDLCVSGKPIRAPEALKLGLIDRVIEGDLLTGAVAFAREIADHGGALRKTRELSDKLGSEFVDASIFAAGRDQARKTRRNMLAPLKVVDAIEAAVNLPFDEGCKKEREIFEECIASDQARALIHAFFAERAVSKIPDIPKETAVYNIRQAAIIGAGTMGGGIAMACANAGISVLLKEVEQAALDRGLATIRKNYENSVKKGRFSQEDSPRAVARAPPLLRSATHPSHIASAAIKQGGSEVRGDRERAENCGASEARDTAQTSCSDRHRAQKADDLRQFHHQRQRIHPHRARLVEQGEIDGGDQRGERGAKLGTRDFSRAAEVQHQLARRRKNQHDRDGAEHGRKRTHRSHAVAAKRDPSVQRGVIEREFAGIERSPWRSTTARRSGAVAPAHEAASSALSSAVPNR